MDARTAPSFTQERYPLRATALFEIFRSLTFQRNKVKSLLSTLRFDKSEQEEIHEKIVVEFVVKMRPSP